MRGRVRLARHRAPLDLLEGFASLDELRLILTHPVAGYYRRLDGTLGSYSIWHDAMTDDAGHTPSRCISAFMSGWACCRGPRCSSPIRFSSVPQIAFEIYLPPQRLGPEPLGEEPPRMNIEQVRAQYDEEQRRDLAIRRDAARGRAVCGALCRLRDNTAPFYIRIWTRRPPTAAIRSRSGYFAALGHEVEWKVYTTISRPI